MESPKTKKQKVHKETQASLSLNDICEWKQSDEVAIKYCHIDQTCKNITYAQLYSTSLSISNHLQNTNASQFIGIANDVPSYCIPGLILGIMSSGRAFVCLPCSTTKNREVCEKLKISHTFLWQEMAKRSVLGVYTVHDEKILLTGSNENLQDCSESKKVDSDFAYAIMTSGSTGKPKIVRVTHDSIVPNILDLKKLLEMSERDTVAQITPLTFDPSVIEIFLSLSSGGSLFVASDDLKNDPETLLKMLLKFKVSVLQSTPSLLLERWSNDELKNGLLGGDTSLRILLIGGERFPSRKIFTKIRSPDNRTRIFDIYGITEVSCWASIREIEKDHECLALGPSLSDTILEVRNKEGKRVEEGEGIVFIGSNSRLCAIDDEDIRDLKKPVFRDTGDIAVIDRQGQINLRGRRGRRVKRYGTRLYLSDLESHVQELSFVENCYALFIENNQSLHLYFTTSTKLVNEAEKFKRESEVSSHINKLDDIYRPDKTTMLNRFELTSNGKICKNYLKKYTRKLDRVSGINVSELSVAETLENIWKRFLPVREELGFLSAGGSSVIALRIANLFEEKVGKKCPKLMSLLLKNENLEVCREYVTRKIPNPMTSENSEITEGSSGENVDGVVEEILTEVMGKQFVAENERKFVAESKRPNENPDKIIPWQSCRGRSSFQNFHQPHKKAWTTATNIELMNRYDLKKCVDASPTIFKYPGGPSYATVGSHAGIICTAELSKENSNLHWQVSLPNRIEASVLVVEDFKGIVGTYDGFLYCVDLKIGRIFWKFKTDDIVKCTAVLCSKNRNVLFGSYDRKAYCVSLENGSAMWSVKAGNGSICATPCINGELNCVLFASLDGTCVSLNQDSGEINWLYKLDYPVFSGPIILESGSAVFCEVSGNLNFVSAASGKKLRSVKIDGNIFSHLNVYKDPETNLQSILFGSANQKLYKMKLQSKEAEPIFEIIENINTPIASTPSTDGNIIAVAGNDGNLKIVDFINGELLYHYKLEGDVFSSPVIREDFIVVGCRDNFLYIFLRHDKD